MGALLLIPRKLSQSTKSLICKYHQKEKAGLSLVEIAPAKCGIILLARTLTPRESHVYLRPVESPRVADRALREVLHASKHLSNRMQCADVGVSTRQANVNSFRG